MAAVTICSDFGAQENKICRCFCFPPIYLLWSDGTECYDLSFLNVVFKPDFLLLSFTIMKRLFSSSSLSAIRVVSPAYLRLLLFLLAILIPEYSSSSLAFHMMYSAGWQYTALPYSFSNLKPVLCSMSGSISCFLSCLKVSQEAGKVVWYSHLFKNLPVCSDPQSPRF